MLARGALAALAYGFLQPVAVDLHVCADGDVVDRDPGILAQQVIGVLRYLDVPDHGAEYRLPGRVRLAAIQPRETLLDVRRQDFERADVELLARLLYFSQIYLHWRVRVP